MNRRLFLWLIASMTSGGLLEATPVEPRRYNPDMLVQLANRTGILRARSLETVGPMIRALEDHSRTLLTLLGIAQGEHYRSVGALAAETAWLTANAHSDSANDDRALSWGKTAARIARDIGDQNLRAHAITRVSRTYMSLDAPAAALAVLHRVGTRQLSPHARARVEVHRALASARHLTDPSHLRARQAFVALERARIALLDEAPGTERPLWVWWRDDEAFLLSWEAETLRSLELPKLAEPVFRDILLGRRFEDNRERPFLQAGLAEIMQQRGELDEAADEGVRAITLAHAVRADGALGRVERLHARLTETAPDNPRVRALGQAVGDYFHPRREKDR
jgi:hypothetical protein